jgi:hypothetical protein
VQNNYAFKHDGLKSPPHAIHALDRAADLISIVMEMTFDIPALVISCKMVDVTVEEWRASVL